MDWDTRYRTGDFTDSPASELLIEAAKPMIPTRALDIACGAGRNALELARRGWAVTAVDSSEGAIAIVESRAAEAGVKIDTRLLDLAREPLPFEEESFDLVALFHYLDRALVPQLQRLVAPGGVFVAAIHTVNSDPGQRPRNPDYILQQGELRSWFTGWEILRDHEAWVAEIVARKARI